MRPLKLPETSRRKHYWGLVASAQPWAAAFIAGEHEGPVWCITTTVAEAEQCMEALRLGLKDKNRPMAFLPPPAGPEAEEKRRLETACDRLQILCALHGETSPAIICTTLGGLLQPAPDPGTLAHGIRILKTGETASPRILGETLGRVFGYSNEAVCEAPGQYSIRGGLLDVYPLQAEAPCRIDFFGDVIESIRTFDPTTQRSEGELKELRLTAASLLEGGNATLAAYRKANTLWCFLDLENLRKSDPLVFQVPETIESKERTLQPWLEGPAGKEDCWVDLSWLDREPPGFGSGTSTYTVASEGLETWLPELPAFANLSLTGYSQQAEREKTLQTFVEWSGSGQDIHFLYRSDNERERIQAWLQDATSLQTLNPQWIRGSLAEGFRFIRGGGLFEGMKSQAFIPVFKLLGYQPLPSIRKPGRRLVRHSQVDQLLDFSEMEEGSTVVHLAHGICLFRGLKKVDDREVLTLEFADKALLHVPLQEAHLLSRYVGLSKRPPKLAKLGSGHWEKTRRAAEAATLDYASKLLRLQAERESHPGHAFAPDHVWQERFEKTFPFRETPDQLEAIRQTKRDMEQPRPMDRLICGDVGFGKTEIALRAAFKAVMDGKQVAILVPTTVLCQQHYNQFRERMMDFPVRVEMLSRFRRPIERSRIRTDLQNGSIDVVVGTHSLIAGTTRFHDLGLLVIDEEHRFGVRHKERLKELKNNVDVLTLSATPIPRTLYLALSGARSLSVMETPPVDRRPIETYVRTYDVKLIREVIAFELERGGQVFYLHNRVQTIEKVASLLRELFPDRSVGVGHGQMAEAQLEGVMTDFVNQRYDILVCTTIIESGLDIPNCNTLIIEGADRFGLAQLYQIRGRVGRFRRQAYAYLLLHKHTSLLDPARKRLDAIRQYSHLGAGYRIAMRDLELRGAGNLLGNEQSGMIAGIGFELYCQLLQQSIARLKGDKSAQVIRTTLRFDFVSQGREKGTEHTSGEASVVGYRAIKAARQTGPGETVEACIPADYLPEPRLRIDLYRKLAMAGTEAEVQKLGESMGDRFGKPPAEVNYLLALTRIRTVAQSRGLTSVETEGNILKCRKIRSHDDPFVRIGSRFPRLQARTPKAKIKEILDFLNRLPPLE